MWEGPQRRARRAPPTFRVAQRLPFLARQFATVALGERQTDVDLPSPSFQMLSGDKGVAAIVTFACKNDASLRMGKELPHGARHPGAGLVHQILNLHPARESSFLGCSHLCRR